MNYFFSRFNSDLKRAVIYDANNILKNRTKEKFLFGLFVFFYILSKPFLNQYIPRLLREEKIKKLKKDGLYILD